MKKLLFVIMILVATGINAQNGVTNEFRFGQGEDSLKCLQAISISNINVKNKDYKTAYPEWKYVFTEFPVARVDTYTNGVKILTELIKSESDPAKKEDYKKELILVYDQQIKYLDKLQEITKSKLSAGQLLGRKAMACIQHFSNLPTDTIYAMLAKAVEMEQGKSEYTVTERFIKYSAMKYKADKSHGDQLIEDYLKASVYIVEVLDKYHDNIEACNQRYQEQGNPRDSINAMQYGKMIDASRIAKSNIDAYFINSGAATCEDLDKIYLANIEANKDNIEYLGKVISVMSMLKCTESDAYLTASEYALAIEPTSKAAMGCGYRYFSVINARQQIFGHCQREFVDLQAVFQTLGACRSFPAFPILVDQLVLHGIEGRAQAGGLSLLVLPRRCGDGDFVHYPVVQRKDGGFKSGACLRLPLRIGAGELFGNAIRLRHHSGGIHPQ